MSFRRAWTRFLRRGHTWPPTPGVREAWHQGRRDYHVWVIELEGARDRRDRVYTALSPWLTPFCHDDPHVTVWVHGFAPPPLHPEEGRHVEIQLGGASSFATCPFLEARCDELRALRAGFSTPEKRWAGYLPHVTVGRYRQRLVAREVAAALAPFRRLPPIFVRGRFAHRIVDAFAEDGAFR